VQHITRTQEYELKTFKSRVEGYSKETGLETVLDEKKYILLVIVK